MPICINKSGKSVPVYDYYDSDKQIGSLYSLELFSLVPQWGGDGVFNFIVFRNSSGNLVKGCLNETKYSYPASVYSNAYQSAYKHGTIVRGGVTYNTFKLIRNEEIYWGDGGKWGTALAGSYVATSSDGTGDSHPDWKLIHYVLRDGTNWEKVEGKGYPHGFVDSGLNQGSMYNTISLAGKWT